jgi:hypothetical protein
MISKKMRWVINGDTLHIQIKGPSANRPYGMAVDVPLTEVGGKSGYMEPLGDCKSLAGTGRRYTKGVLAIEADDKGAVSGTWLCHWPTQDLPDAFGMMAAFSFKADCSILTSVFDYVKANGKLR